MPLVYSYGLKYGLQDSDAADLAQETIRRVFRAIDSFEYDPNKGSFRGWLLTVARNELRRMKNRLDGTTSGSGDTDPASSPKNRPETNKINGNESISYTCSIGLRTKLKGILGKELGKHFG